MTKADYITEDGYNFYIQADYSVADTPDGVDSDMSWPTIKDFQDDMETEGIEITSNHNHTSYWTDCELCKHRPAYEMEHSGFFLPEGVVFPEGFEDYSWHNDEYPRWQYKTDDMDVYHAGITILYQRGAEDWDAIKAEGIYIFETTTAEGGFNESNGHDITIVQTNDWNKIIAAFEAWKNK